LGTLRLGARSAALTVLAGLIVGPDELEELLAHPASNSARATSTGVARAVACIAGEG